MEPPILENHGKRWSLEQDEWLFKTVKGKGPVYCATEMKRTVGSIRSRLNHIVHGFIKDNQLSIEAAAEHIHASIESIEEYIAKKSSETHPILKEDGSITPVKPQKIYFYAVRMGKQPGIYTTWEECKAQVQLFHSKYKKFSTLEEAEKYMQEEEVTPIIQNTSSLVQKKSSIVLNEQQLQVLDYIKDGKNIFLSGAAGTGKTTTIHAIVNYANTNRVSVGLTATTGCAAVLINGKTIHSYLGIGLGKLSPQALASKVVSRYPKKFKELNELKILIIDEISMMPSNLFTKISKFLSVLRQKDAPFGGVKVVLSGDFYQLPPIEDVFCFKALEWKEMNFITHILTYNYRQDTDHLLQDILNRIRNNEITKEDIQVLNECRNTEFPAHIFPTRIYPLNKNVDQINKDCFNKIFLKKKGTECTYMTYYENKKSKEFAERIRIPESLILCTHAQVMITRNIDIEKGIINGTRGRVERLSDTSVWIKLLNGKEIEISFVDVRDDDDANILIRYIPLTLAYAITVHKSQGITLDAAELDIGSRIFEYGQAYTALSRVKNLKSLRIVDVEMSSFRTHPDVIKFYQQMV